MRALLEAHWGLAGAEIVDHHGGMNSRTWFVTAGGVRYVAKCAAGDWFPGGIAVADALARRGFASGAPVRTTDGRLTIPATSGVAQGGRLALLAFVDGTATEDPGRIGARLAEVHRLLRGVTVDGEVAMDWVDPGAAHLGLRPWLREAVAEAVHALHAQGPLTEGLLHADPAPEAFVGHGLIDWGVALRGPLLYDVASALMYLGDDAGDAFLDAYGRAGTIPDGELRDALPVLVRFRYAVQADYFARRIAGDDLTGIAGPAENEKGLEDARRALRA
ncbi:phosphotransferase [Dactylosporangium sp. NPDC049742]|uniref:phosphotransferase enzyme family protein n=1 Tax=Dactylosporangium sp. NPDC049742 TaxID=3154737 RepID=UPI003445A861